MTMTRFGTLFTATLALALAQVQVQAFVPRAVSSVSPTFTRTPVRLYAEEKPFAVIVQATIEPDRMAEFMELIETNAVNTRKERGCIRFDVLRSQESPNEFFFYELYKNAEAIDFHKTQPHYNLWADFKASGGTIASVSHKTDGEFLS
jgi:quinol monooxygenase YgiN